MLNSPLNTSKQRQYNQPTSLSGGFFSPSFSWLYLCARGIAVPTSMWKSSWDTLVECRVGQRSTSSASASILWKTDTILQEEGNEATEIYTQMFFRSWPTGIYKWFFWVKKMNEPRLFFHLSGRSWSLRLLRRFWNGGEQPRENIPDKHTRLTQAS